MSKRLQAVFLCCVVIAASLQTARADENTTSAGEALSLTAENVNKVSDAFLRLLSDPYNLSGKVLPNDASIARAGLSPETVKAAEGLRTQLRQSLSDVVAIAADRTSAFVKAAQAELDKAGGGGGELLQRLSAIPLKFDEKGTALVSNPLTAIGAFLVNTLQQQLKAVRQAGGEELSQQLGESSTGRRLLQEMDAFEASVEEGEEEEGDLDVTQPSPRQGPVAVAKQMDRLMSFLTSLTDAAEEVLGHFEDINAQAEAAAKGDDEADSESDLEGSISARLRRLQQGEDPNAGYAKAARIIFTNVFDLFRANGLYGLTPLIADLRGILTRYNWIADVLNLIDSPLENFINANYLPLPQNNDDFTKLVQTFAKNYCKLEEAENSETVLGEFEGPSVSYEVKPVSCPIYQDPDSGRNYVSFEDCSAATLTIKVNPLSITEAYFTPATYSGTECKYVEPYGIDLDIKAGGGEQAFSFVRSAKGIDIIPTASQVDVRTRIRGPFAGPEVAPDADLPTDPAVGNGFVSNNFGFDFTGVNPPAAPAAPAPGAGK